MDSTIVLQWVVALGLGAILTELIRSAFQRRKMGADAAKVITEATTALLGPLQERIKQLEATVEETRVQLMRATDELAEARAEVHALRMQLAIYHPDYKENP